MTVVGLYSTLSDLKSGLVDLDFEGNEGDVWIHKPEELERADSQSTDWDKVRINAAIVNMQTLMAQSWQMEADEVAASVWQGGVGKSNQRIGTQIYIHRYTTVYP